MTTVSLLNCSIHFLISLRISYRTYLNFKNNCIPHEKSQDRDKRAPYILVEKSSKKKVTYLPKLKVIQGHNHKSPFSLFETDHILKNVL